MRSEWHQANKQRLAVYWKGYYQQNRERLNAQSSLWRKNNPERQASYKRKQKYGLTEEQYREKWSNQAGACAICGGVFEELHVDHCHDTGKVRGLLCGQCNVGLGMMQDSASNLQNAIAYLEYHHWEED